MTDRFKGILSPLNILLQVGEDRVVEVSKPTILGDRAANILELERTYGPYAGNNLRLQAAVRDGLMTPEMAGQMMQNFVGGQAKAQNDAGFERLVQIMVESGIPLRTKRDCQRAINRYLEIRDSFGR